MGIWRTNGCLFYENRTRPHSHLYEVAPGVTRGRMDIRRTPNEGRKKKPYTEPEFAISGASRNFVRDGLRSSKIWERARTAVIRLFERLLFEPRSRAQTAQLARKIRDYALIHRTGSELTVIGVPEMAVCFREPRRHVLQSLRLLEEQGIVERTNSTDHWKMTNRGSIAIITP